MNKEDIDQIAILIKELYKIVSKLEEHFPGRHFTPDGHLVGSIGEVLAAYYYSLKLLPASAEKHDAETIEGKKVQIKATQGKTVGIRSNPDYLLVLKINIDDKVEEIYNGPGNLAWDMMVRCRKMDKNLFWYLS